MSAMSLLHGDSMSALCLELVLLPPKGQKLHELILFDMQYIESKSTGISLENTSPVRFGKKIQIPRQMPRT